MSFALPQDVAHFRTLVIKSAAIKPDGEADICNWVKHRLGLDATNATVQIEPGVQAIVKFDATARLKKRALKAPLKMSGKAVTLVALAVEILQLEVESLDDVTAALHDEIGEDHVEHVEIVPGIENAVVVMLASEEGLLAALGVPSLTIGGSEFNISSV
jgi:ABC-type arginine transport system ATPase subunit